MKKYKKRRFERPLPDLPPLKEVLRDYILHVLELCAGNRTVTASILRVDRKTLQRKLRATKAHKSDPSEQ